MLRGRPYLLPVLGGCLLVGGLVGVQLGQSAIAGINPIHFQGAAPPPKAAAQAVQTAAGADYLEAYGWPEGQAARAQECGDCVVSQETYAFGDMPQAERLAAIDWREPNPAEEEAKPLPAEELRAPGPIERVVGRYTDYPIEEGREEAKPDKPQADWENDVYED